MEDLMNILTADEFIAQGTTAAAVMSIADHLESGGGDHVLDRKAASALRVIARQVADKTGGSLHIPGAVTEARLRGRASNNNRDPKLEYGKPRSDRRAA
jgi:hypothetical protein